LTILFNNDIINMLKILYKTVNVGAKDKGFINIGIYSVVR